MLWACNPTWHHCYMANPDPAREALGLYIRNNRESAGLSQSQLAQHMSNAMGNKMYQTTIGRIENGERSLSLTEAVVIADILNIPVATLGQMAAPSTPETARQNYAHKIADATNSIMSSVGAVKSLVHASQDIENRFSESKEIPENLQKLVAKIPGEQFIFEHAANVMRDLADEIHNLWAPWMFEQNINGYLDDTHDES